LPEKEAISGFLEVAKSVVAVTEGLDEAFLAVLKGIQQVHQQMDCKMDKFKSWWIADRLKGGDLTLRQ